MSECCSVSKGKMNWFTKLIFSIMLIVLAIYPFGLAVVNMVQVFADYWDMFTLSVMAIAVGLMIVFCAATMQLGGKRMSKSQVVGISIGLFSMSMVIRVLCSYLLQSQPVSDFKTCFDYAVDSLTNRLIETNGGYLKKYSYVGAYALVMRTLFGFFPPLVLTVQVFNAAVQSLIPVFLFLGVRRFMGDDRPAIAGAVLYAFNPSMIVYSSSLSGEHISQMLAALALMIHAYWVGTTSGKKKYVLSVVLGATLGWLNVFKTIMVIFAAAIAMASVCYQLIPAVRSLLHKETNAKKRVLRIVGCIALVLVVAVAVNNIGVFGVRTEIQGEAEDEAVILGELLYMGLHPETAGLWDAEVRATLDEVKALYPDGGEATRVLLQKLADLYQGDISLFVTAQMKKLDYNWCREATYYYWTNATTPVVQGTDVGVLLFEFVPDLFAIGLYAFCSLGSIIALIRMLISKQQNLEKSQSLFVCVGCIFLFTIMLMLIETQGRYKSNIMPYVCCLGGIGIWMIMDSMTKVYYKIKINAEAMISRRKRA